MRAALALLLMLSLTSCSGAVATYKLYSFQGDLVMRLLACDWQVRCRDGACVVKWSCPYGFKN